MPEPDSYGQGLSLATLTDAPNAATLVHGIVDETLKRLNNRYASASERGATVTAPEEGMVTYLRDANLLQLFDGASWQTVLASTLPWANVQLATGYQAYVGSTVGPRVRREGNIVYLEGRLSRTSGDIPQSDSVTLGTVPAAYRPVGHYAEGFTTTSNSGNGTPLGRIEIWHTDGTIRYWSDRPTNWVGFSSWWFVN